MSITVRLWTDDDFQNLSTDDNLLTMFFNSKTIEEKGLGYFRRLLGRRKTYHVYFNTENGLDSSEVYAASDTSLRWFLNQEYDYNTICYMEEVITTYREVTVLDIKQQMQSELTADEFTSLASKGSLQND